MQAKRKLLVGVLSVLAVVGVGLAVFWTRARKASAPVFPPTAAADARRGIGALGTLEPASRVVVLSPSTQGGRLAVLLTEEGREVGQGELLGWTDDRDQREAELRQALSQARVAQSQLELTAAGAKPEDLSAQRALVAAARETLKQRTRDLKRYDVLEGANAISRQSLEQQESGVESARAAVAEAESRLAALAVVREVELRLKEAELATARDAVDVARAALARTQLIAPISARVLRINARSGERIGDRGVLEMGNVARMHAVAEVYEADVPLVKLGMAAAVRVKSTDLLLEGRVVKITPLVGRKVALDNDPVSDTDARVVEVRIELSAPDSARVAELTNARVEVVIEKS